MLDPIGTIIICISFIAICIIVVITNLLIIYNRRMQINEDIVTIAKANTTAIHSIMKDIYGNYGVCARIIERIEKLESNSK